MGIPVRSEFFGDPTDILFGAVRVLLEKRACCVEGRTEGIATLRRELFLQISRSRFATLRDVSGERSYRVPWLIAGGHSHSLTSPEAVIKEIDEQKPKEGSNNGGPSPALRRGEQVVRERMFVNGQ